MSDLTTNASKAGTLSITVAARSSNLSKAQIHEVLEQLHKFHPNVSFLPKFCETKGDLDKLTSLRELEKTNFFTDVVDELVLQRKCRIAIHSAKDLPDPLPKGLKVVAITEGQDPRDALVFPIDISLSSESVIATSSERREKLVRKVFPDVRFVDLRGTIEERLSQIDRKNIHGVVIAEAALIRLGLGHLNRILLDGETTPLQGKLAIVSRDDDLEMQKLFLPLDTREKILYLGLDPSRFIRDANIIHLPVIYTERIHESPLHIESYSHVIFTSKTAVDFFRPSALINKTVIAIGPATEKRLHEKGIKPITAPRATQEGVIELLSSLDLQDGRILWPKSSLSRDVLEKFFIENNIFYTAVDLYHTKTLFQKTIDLEHIDEIIFTSPSTVDGFVNNYGNIPICKTLTCIGPITKAYLSKTMYQTELSNS